MADYNSRFIIMIDKQLQLYIAYLVLCHSYAECSVSLVAAHHSLDQQEGVHAHC